MNENSNKTLALNTVILYVRMSISVICSLFITRFALEALGENDFGLFSVVGSINSFVAIINTIMLSTTNRYLTVALGKGDESEVNRVFNVCMVIHIIIAMITAIIAFPIGEWFINKYINYTGSIENVLMVYRLSILACIFSFISVPYNGLLMAKEKFIVFCGVDVISNVLKLGAAILLLFFFEEKLMFYATTQAVFTAYPTIVFWLYCKKHYRNFCHWQFCKDKSLYKEMAGFSGWVSYGAIATIGKTQGAQLLVNAFFNTAMNAALGIANTINALITTFSSNVTQPMAPQMTKSYAAGDMQRCNNLLVMSTKFSFLVILVISSPFFSEIDWILNLWLGEAPPYVALFTKLMIIDALVGTFNAGISNIVFANGKIAFYQLTVNTSKLLAIYLAYLVLKAGASPISIFSIYILLSVVNVVFIQIALHRVGGFSFWILAKKSYIPSIIVAALYTMILYIEMPLHPISHMIVVLLYLLMLIWFVGFSKNERMYIWGIMMKMKQKVLGLLSITV